VSEHIVCESIAKAKNENTLNEQSVKLGCTAVGEKKRYRKRRFLAVAGITLAAAFGTFNKDAKSTEALGQTTQEQLVRHMEIGIEDDGILTGRSEGSPDQVFQAGEELDAKWLRMIIYSEIFLTPQGPQIYLEAEKAAHDAGYKVLISISCRGLQSSLKDFHNYFSRIINLSKDNVDAYSVCNEANFPGGLKKLPGKTVPQTYRIVHDDAYQLIKNLDPKALELAFDSAPQDALQFIEDTVDYCPDSEKDPKTSECPPFKTAAI
jgi:hypothetical protein